MIEKNRRLTFALVGLRASSSYAMRAISTIFLVLSLVLVPLVRSFVSSPLRSLSAKQKIRQKSSRRITRVTDDKLSSMATPQAESQSETEDSTQGFVSLASDYRVDISSSHDHESWSLVPIADVIKEDNSSSSLPEGARANRALQTKGVVSKNPSCTLQCSLDGDAIVVTTDSQQLDSVLLATLSRIMIQRLAPIQQDAGTVKDYSISLPNEESILIESLCEEDSILKLFEPLLDTSKSVELVEMVERSGIPLGMVPRPLVHTFNLLHRGIGMVVAKDSSINKQSTEFPPLYVHRRTDDKRIFPSLYDMFVGGVSSADEDATTTAAREVSEELGIARALVDSAALSAPLFDCTVCTAYNRCVVTVFCFEYESLRDSISWQEEEVAWGSFVPYSVIESSARLCIERMVSAGSWPGEAPFALTLENQDSGATDDYESEVDWVTWDYVPDGLLVWEAWLKWQSRQPN